MSAILYSMIHQKAELTYKGPAVTASNYKLWAIHWFNTAAELANDFEESDLPATAKAVREIEAEQRKLLR